MALYVRGSGGYIAERVQPEPGSDHEAELEHLAEDPATNWRRVDEPRREPEPPALPARSASKALWKVYAVAHGMAEADADAATRDQLAEKYHGNEG